MKFQAGDAVMHWMHGLGTIIRLEKRDLFGQAAMYYAVKVDDMTVWVPVDANLAHRLRHPTSKAGFKRLLATLSKPGETLPDDRHDRKLALTELLHDGRAESLVRVIRALSTYRKVRSLNFNDQAQLKRAQESLVGEWGYILSITPQQAEAELQHILGDPPHRA